MPALNTDTSVVDYLKSTGKDSSYASRAKLAESYGITGYVGNADQNTLLLTKIRGGSSTPAATGASDPSKVNSTEDANAYINNNQQQDFSQASKTNEPPVRSSLSNYQDLYDSITKTLTSNLPTKPETPKFADQYTTLRGSYGVTDLESQLTDLKTQQKDLFAASKARTDAEKAKPVAMNVIEGRVSEEEKQDQERLDGINRSIDTISSQLTQKYAVIDNIMKYAQTDYSNAVDSYDRQFTQNLNMFNTIKGVVDSEKSDEERKADNARANLQIIYNNVTDNGASLTNLGAEDKANITKLELQAGLPVGFYSKLQAKDPNGTIVSTTTRESGGQKFADVIIKGKDGSLSSKTISLGASSGTGSETQADKKATAYAGINTLLTGNYKTPSGAPYVLNGYLTYDGWKAIAANAIEDGITRADLVAQYADKFAPEVLDEAGGYGLTGAEKKAIRGY